MVHRIPQSEALTVIDGETFRKMTVVIYTDKDKTASSISKGADLLTKFLHFRWDFSFEFNVLPFSLGNQFQYFLLVNHVHTI